MLVVLSGLVEEALQLWQASCSSGRFWQPLEAALYACNIASAKTSAGDMPYALCLDHIYILFVSHSLHCSAACLVN